MPNTALVYGREPISVDPDGEALWLDAVLLPEATGWELKPEGVCRGGVCVPIPPSRASQFVRDGRFNLRAFADHLGQPVVYEPEGATWVIGEAAADRASRLEGQAPDFELPDISGAMHRLADHRGKKALVVTWGSW